MNLKQFATALFAGVLIASAPGFAMGKGDPKVFSSSTATEDLRSFETNKDFGERGYSYIQAHVTRVADGDTITVKTSDGEKKKVRLLGIDAPELKMPAGNESKRHLEYLLKKNGNDVKIYFSDRKREDRYGRIIGKVVSGNVDINGQMIADGHAWYFKNYRKDIMHRDRDVYERSMYQAQKQRLGLWAQDNPEEPWEWRKYNRRN